MLKGRPGDQSFKSPVLKPLCELWFPEDRRSEDLVAVRESEPGDLREGEMDCWVTDLLMILNDHA